MLQEETLARKFVQKGFWLYLFTFLIWPLGYIIKMIISRDLTVWEVWMIYGVISLVTLIGVYNDLGFTESLNFFLPKYIINKEFSKAKYLLKLSLFTQLLSSIIIALILFVFAPGISEHYFHNPNVTEILQIAGLYFIGANILHISSTIFSVAQDTKFQKLTDFLRMLSTAIGAWILFWTDNGSTVSYMWSWVGWLGIAMIFWISFAYIKYYRFYFSGIKSTITPHERRQFIHYAWATLLTANIATLLSQIDMQVIIFFLWDIATGYYSNYLSLMNIPFIFLSPIVAFLFPVISELHGRDDTKKMQIIHNQFSLYFSIIGIWIGVFMFQFWEELAIIFFGEQFRESGNILKYSSPFLVFNLLIQINFQLLAWTGKIRDRAKILLAIIPINLILNLIFIRLYGVSWAALAVGLSWIPLWYMSHRATKKHHSTFSFIPVIKNTLLASITFFVLELLREDFPSNVLILSFAVLVNLIIFSWGNFKMLQEIIVTIRNNRH